jgi:hypothetical protein
MRKRVLSRSNTEGENKNNGGEMVLDESLNVSKVVNFDESLKNKDDSKNKDNTKNNDNTKKNDKEDLEDVSVHFSWKCRSCHHLYPVVLSLAESMFQKEDDYICDNCTDNMSCYVCDRKDGEHDEFLICDKCDKNGAHLKCLGYSRVPEQKWFCVKCVKSKFNDVYKRVREEGAAMSRSKVWKVTKCATRPMKPLMLQIVESTFFAPRQIEIGHRFSRIWGIHVDTSKRVPLPRDGEDDDIGNEESCRWELRAMFMVLYGIYCQSHNLLKSVKKLVEWMASVTSEPEVVSYLKQYNEQTWMKHYELVKNGLISKKKKKDLDSSADIYHGDKQSVQELDNVQGESVGVSFNKERLERVSGLRSLKSLSANQKKKKERKRGRPCSTKSSSSKFYDLPEDNIGSSSFDEEEKNEVEVDGASTPALKPLSNPSSASTIVSGGLKTSHKRLKLVADSFLIWDSNPSLSQNDEEKKKGEKEKDNTKAKETKGKETKGKETKGKETPDAVEYCQSLGQSLGNECNHEKEDQWPIVPTPLRLFEQSDSSAFTALAKINDAKSNQYDSAFDSASECGKKRENDLHQSHKKYVESRCQQIVSRYVEQAKKDKESFEALNKKLNAILMREQEAYRSLTDASALSQSFKVLSDEKAGLMIELKESQVKKRQERTQFMFNSVKELKEEMIGIVDEALKQQLNSNKSKLESK